MIMLPMGTIVELYHVVFTVNAFSFFNIDLFLKTTISELPLVALFHKHDIGFAFRWKTT